MTWIRQLFVFCLGLTFFLLSSCRMNGGASTHAKKSGKDSLKTDFFQNFTAKYNILHHANLMLDAERKAVFLATDKNYQVRLTVFDEPTATGDPHQAMDSLIQKAYKIVNEKQASKYINDAYFLIGRAYYFKGAYYTAVEFFDQLTKDNSNQQKSFSALAYAWKSRALLQINKAAAAGKAVDSAFMFLDDDKATRTFIHAAKANYLIRTGEEMAAIPYLEYAIASNKQRMDDARWTFLLAQLYRDKGEKEKAQRGFFAISNGNVPFDMAFEAALQAAFLQGNDPAHTVAQRVKPFRAMLKEGKNEGYQDQILYEMGKVFLNTGDEQQAMRLFEQSLQKNRTNVFQVTDTYVTIADYFFEKKQYRKAQLYYDSTATVLPPTYTDVNKIRRKLAFMGELTPLYEENLWQDTLLTLAELDEQARLKNIDAYAAAALAAVNRGRQETPTTGKAKKIKQATSENTAINNALLPDAPINTAVARGNTFYFNNPDALLLGAAEFKRKWGNRQLKDDWRFVKDHTPGLSETRAVAVVETASPLGQDTLNELALLEVYRQKYLDSLPLTADEVARREKIVHDNMIVIGNIYRDYTRDMQEAIRAHELFIARFPNATAAAEIYYALFTMYERIDPSKSLHYKNRLIEQFPHTIHASLAKDRYYLDKVNRDKRLLDRAFEQLFNLYVAGDHVAVIKQANDVLVGTSLQHGMAAQIAYLKALAIGRVGRLTDFTYALEQIVTKYPDDSLVVPLVIENQNFIANNPSLFTHRVNALQDKDNLRIAFVEEPNMTPWPALFIDGDYRTAEAIKKTDQPIVELPKDVAPPQPAAKPVEKRLEIELLLANEREKGANTIAVASVDKASGLQLVKKETQYRASLTSNEAEELLDEQAGGARVELDLMESGSLALVGENHARKQSIQLGTKAVDVGSLKIDFGPNEYRDKKLFPDTATYYFVVNVLDPRVNLAPSRYGIGQFNRSRYARTAINHQLKLVNAENQLLFVGPFETFEEVKTYETRILPLLSEIMKVPQEDYNSFVITSVVLGTLTDGIQIKNYHQVYIEQ
ncbi:gliding motility protein [Sphingobacterium oryzagri]|uniref:Gliding motility protein n=1 Tax=Sphingobacterium oryzagri TaxID=3025669 RepID=A0ABY7WKE3_9SPHI|nr:gliding motility protein [Sphingobacterium sp. KACC 22765]WDF69450.1 gliding motility protein [Sphingobacterium sp. KACC 22765]